MAVDLSTTPAPPDARRFPAVLVEVRRKVWVADARELSRELEWHNAEGYDLESCTVLNGNAYDYRFEAVFVKYNIDH